MQVSCKIRPLSGLVAGSMAGKRPRLRQLGRGVARVLAGWINDPEAKSMRGTAALADLDEGTVRNLGAGTGASLTLDNIDDVLPKLGRTWEELLNEAGAKAAGNTTKELETLRAERAELLGAMGAYRRDTEHTEAQLAQLRRTATALALQLEIKAGRKEAAELIADAKTIDEQRLKALRKSTAAGRKGDSWAVY
jgi:hypothetical protein